MQTDVFNLGATHVLVPCTGQHIPTLYTVNKKGENSFLLDDRIDTPQDLNPKVPTAISNLIVEMIATRVQKRPADMDSVINRLELGKHVLTKQTNGFTPDPEISNNLDDSNAAGVPRPGH